MLKRFAGVIAAILVLTSLNSFKINGISKDISVLIDGMSVEFPDAKPLINSDSRTLCPIRFIAEDLGANVQWINETRTVKIVKGLKNISINIGESKAFVNEKEILFDTKAQIIDQRTYVPLRFISETLEMDVQWDNKTKTVAISRPNKGELVNQDPLNDEESKISNNLDKYMYALEKNKNFHGSVLVAKGGKILLDKGYGKANYETNTNNTPLTRFAIGSITKQFTAMAIMQLYEKGLLSVEDKLSKYIPQFKRGDQITLKHLLTHTSGIASFTELSEVLTMDVNGKDADYIIDIINKSPLEFEPGEKWKYSNSGYLILGRIVEKVSGKTLEDYLKENIFDPLEMNNTGASYTNGKKMYNSQGYVGFLDNEPISDEFLLKVAYGAGYLYSTVEDLYKWDRALNTEKIVSKKTMDMIFTKYIDTKLIGSYGFGWFIEENNELGKIVLHGGNTLGFTSNIVRYIDTDITIITSTNTGYYDNTILTMNLTDIIRGINKELPQEIIPVEMDPKTLEYYTGTYESNNLKITITKEENQLYAQLTGQMKAKIYPMSQTKFFYRDVDATITFIIKEGKVVSLTLNQGLTKVDAKRTGDVTAGENSIVEIKDKSIYKDYVGEYEIISGYILTISTDGEHLYAKLTGQDKYEIFPKSHTEFFFKVVEASVKFVRNENGNVDSLILSQNGQEIPAKRID